MNKKKLLTLLNLRTLRTARTVPKRLTLLTLTALVTLLTLHAIAAAIKEGYVTRSITLATNTAEVFFPQNPTKAIRLVSFDVTGDTNNSALTLYSGTLPLTIGAIVNATNLQVTSNVGVQTNALVLIQRADDTIFSLTVLMTNQTTNVIIAGTNSIALATSDVLWVATNISTIPIGMNTVRQSGECLFMAQRRAPFSLRVSPGISNTTKINNAVCRYDDN